MDDKELGTLVKALVEKEGKLSREAMQGIMDHAWLANRFGESLQIEEWRQAAMYRLHDWLLEQLIAEFGFPDFFRRNGRTPEHTYIRAYLNFLLACNMPLKEIVERVRQFNFLVLRMVGRVEEFMRQTVTLCCNDGWTPVLMLGGKAGYLYPDEYLPAFDAVGGLCGHKLPSLRFFLSGEHKIDLRNEVQVPRLIFYPPEPYSVEWKEDKDEAFKAIKKKVWSRYPSLKRGDVPLRVEIASCADVVSLYYTNFIWRGILSPDDIVTGTSSFRMNDDLICFSQGDVCARSYRNIAKVQRVLPLIVYGFSHRLS